MSPLPEVIRSRSNARVKQLRALLHAAAPDERGLVAVEGWNLVLEAARSGLALETVFVSERVSLPAGLPPGTPVVWLAEEVFGSVSATEAPQGIAATLTVPEVDAAALLERGPLLLVAAGVQDPGNLGTLIRSAEAFGARGVVTLPGTVGCWNAKCVRASAGSIFRVPVLTLRSLDALRAAGVRLLAAVKDDAADAAQADLAGAVALVIGNEGAGLSEELLAMADGRVTIPCPGAVESLNAAVAGSLLLYEASRQRGGGAGR